MHWLLTYDEHPGDDIFIALFLIADERISGIYGIGAQLQIVLFMVNLLMKRMPNGVYNMAMQYSYEMSFQFC